VPFQALKGGILEAKRAPFEKQKVAYRNLTPHLSATDRRPKESFNKRLSAFAIYVFFIIFAD